MRSIAFYVRFLPFLQSNAPSSITWKCYFNIITAFAKSNVDFQTSWPAGKEVKNTQDVKIAWKGEISNRDTNFFNKIDPRFPGKQDFTARLVVSSIIGQGVSKKSTKSSTKSCQTPISHSKRLRRTSPKNVNQVTKIKAWRF